MRKIIGKLIIIGIISASILLFLFGLYETEAIRTYKIKDFNINAVIDKYGSMKVVEETDYSFKGKYNGITITIPDRIDKSYYIKMTKSSINDSKLSDWLYNNDGIEDVKIYVVENGQKRIFKRVGEASIGNVGVYTEARDANGYVTYTIYEPSKNEDKTFVIEYTLKNVAVLHDDVGEVWWNFVGGGVECKISRLNINVSTQYGNISEAYVHSNESGKVNYINKNTANITVNNIWKNQFVGVRLVFPRANIQDSCKFNHTLAADTIHEQEDSYAKKSNVRFTLNIIAIIITSGIAVYWIYLLLRYEKEYTYGVKAVDDLNILDKYNPMIAACIAQNRDMHPRDILALLIDMVNRKMLDLEVNKTVNDKSTKEEIRYKLKKNKDYFENPDNVEKLDDFETIVLNIFFDGSDEIELESRLRRIKRDGKAISELKALDRRTTYKLNEIGANFVKVPQRLITLNNIIFIISMVYIFVVIAFNIVLGLSTLSTTSSAISINTIMMTVVVFVSCTLLVLPASLFMIKLLVEIIKWIKKLFSKIAFKITAKRFMQALIRITIFFVIIFILEATLLARSYIIICTVLFMTALLLVSTDNLMSSHSFRITGDYIYLKTIEETIKTDSLLDEKKIEDQILWGKYLTFAIALGVGNVSKLVKYIPEIDHIGEVIGEFEKMYDLYGMSRSEDENDKLNQFADRISSFIEKIDWDSYGGSFGGGFSGGGSSSFGGGGFSGGGRRRPEEEELFSIILIKLLTSSEKHSNLYM